MADFPPHNLPFEPSLEHLLLRQIQESNGMLRELVSQNEGLLRGLGVAVNQLQGCPSETERPLRELLGAGGGEFSLGLSEDFPEFLRKGKYFSFEVKLIGRFPRDESLEVFLSVYSSEDVPRLVTRSMTGEKIVKGRVSALLSYDPVERVHIGSFKVLFTEVTSHFLNGWVFVVVTADKENGYLQITGSKVYPLIVDNVVCRAKGTRRGA